MTIQADLPEYGINNATEIICNPDYLMLFEEETRSDLKGYERGKLTESGAVSVDTGIFTGRSPNDKYIVRDDVTRDAFWWADQGENDNKPLSQEKWEILKNRVARQLSGKRLFVVDAFCGANPGQPPCGPICDGSGLAGTFCKKHVYPAGASRA